MCLLLLQVNASTVSSLIPLYDQFRPISLTFSIPYSFTVLPLHKQKQYGADDALNMIVTELATAVGTLGNDDGKAMMFSLMNLLSINLTINYYSTFVTSRDRCIQNTSNNITIHHHLS